MMLDRFAMTDKVAVVTGAGRGIGRPRRSGWPGRRRHGHLGPTTEQLGGVAKQVEAAGRRAVVVAADLSDLVAVAALVETAREAFGRLDVVVNNGAVPCPVPSWTPLPTVSSRPSTSTCPPPTAPPGRAPHARRGRRTR